MKNLSLIILLMACTNVFGQVTVLQGDNSQEFKITKQPKFTSFNNDDADYFVISHKEGFTTVNRLIAADKNGMITTDKEIMPKMSMFTSFDIKNLLVVGKTPVLFVQLRDKKANKNTLTATGIDENGNLIATPIEIASIDFTKMSNAGEWYTALTPDKKHVVVAVKLPYEKNIAEKFQYFIMDENMKQVSKGEFSFAGETKELFISDFLASDKGDLYFLVHDLDQTYRYPMLYKYTAGGQAVIVPVMFSDPKVKSLNYIFNVNPAGELVIAGYTQAKATFSAGDPKATGTWLFNSSKPNEVKTTAFDKPIANMTARNILYNGDTFYLVGEQYLADKQTSGNTGLSAMREEPDYKYTYGDILVTGYINDGTKKFEIPVSRQWSATNFDQDLTVASGVINNKLALVYNDLYGKYIDDKYYKNYKLPVAVLVTNDGLMEAPVTFAKELDVKVSSYTLSPKFFSANKNKLVVLTINPQTAKTVTFR